MKALIATAPRKAELLDYEDREIADNEVKVKVEFASPKHGTEVVDFRGLSPFIDEDYDPEWQIFKKRGDDDEGNYGGRYSVDSGRRESTCHRRKTEVIPVTFSERGNCGGQCRR